MLKCVDKGIWTCISRSGLYKKSYESADIAIESAKFINSNNSNSITKLVAYKCTHCYKYHLMSVYKKFRKT